MYPSSRRANAMCPDLHEESEAKCTSSNSRPLQIMALKKASIVWASDVDAITRKSLDLSPEGHALPRKGTRATRLPQNAVWRAMKPAMLLAESPSLLRSVLGWAGLERFRRGKSLGNDVAFEVLSEELLGLCQSPKLEDFAGQRFVISLKMNVQMPGPSLDLARLRRDSPPSSGAVAMFPLCLSLTRSFLDCHLRQPLVVVLTGSRWRRWSRAMGKSW